MTRRRELTRVRTCGHPRPHGDESRCYSICYSNAAVSSGSRGSRHHLAKVRVAGSNPVVRPQKTRSAAPGDRGLAAPGAVATPLRLHPGRSRPWAGKRESGHGRTWRQRGNGMELRAFAGRDPLTGKKAMRRARTRWSASVRLRRRLECSSPSSRKGRSWATVPAARSMSCLNDGSRSAAG
jgi:hypothetical protein